MKKEKDLTDSWMASQLSYFCNLYNVSKKKMKIEICENGDVYVYENCGYPYCFKNAVIPLSDYR